MSMGISQLENRDWIFRKSVIFQGGVAGNEVGSGVPWFVNGNLSASGDGTSWSNAFITIQEAVTAASANDVVYIMPKGDDGTGDPNSYAETITIAYGKENIALIGVSRGSTQGGLPQIKKGSGSTALLTIRAPGCLIMNLGFNGSGATGGGILLDDDGSTKFAFGTTIAFCHFKNCKGSTATDSRTGGAIQWGANGGAWQTHIHHNKFYKNVGDIVLLGTGVSIPQDVVIEDNIFEGPATSVDCNIYLAAGSGMASVTVHHNVFAHVLPELSSGSVVRYADLTGCTGIFSDNYFGGSYTSTGFGAARAAAKIPTTVGLPHNYTDGGLVVRQ